MSTELIVILVGAGLVALSWLLLRFGKLIARAALAFGVLAAVVIVALALLSQASASREAARTATVASVGQVVGGLVIGGLSVSLLAALVVIAYLVLRLRVTERGRLLPPKRKRRKLPDYEPVVYILETSPTDEMEEIEWINEDWRF